MVAKKKDDDQSLKRLGGGRWQTRDERFTIEPQSGTWVLVDAEQTDDLGLPLVRGPYRSLTDAKAAVAAARGTAPPESPLSERVKEAGTRSPASVTKNSDRRGAPSAKPADARGAPEPEPRPEREPEPPPEPRWIRELAPRDRGRARRLLERLTAAGIRDAENVVRQDLTGDVPSIARLAVAERVAAILASSDDGATTVDPQVRKLIDALGDGRDDKLDVRWRLVDADNRPIGLTADDVRSAMKRRNQAKEETDR
jgi:hypothetical protein